MGLEEKTLTRKSGSQTDVISALSFSVPSEIKGIGKNRSFLQRHLLCQAVPYVLGFKEHSFNA